MCESFVEMSIHIITICFAKEKMRMIYPHLPAPQGGTPEPWNPPPPENYQGKGDPVALSLVGL